MNVAPLTAEQAESIGQHYVRDIVENTDEAAIGLALNAIANREHVVMTILDARRLESNALAWGQVALVLGNPEPDGFRTKTSLEAAIAEVSRLKAIPTDAAKLLQALTRYGAHRSDCSHNRPYAAPGVCSCGLLTAMGEG